MGRNKVYIFVKIIKAKILSRPNIMFKSNSQTRTKSPYQPKLIQHLIDSSDQDNDSFIFGSNDDHSFSYHHENQEEHFESNKNRFNHFVNDDQKSQKSAHTNITQQTTKSNITRQSNNVQKTTNYQPERSNLIQQKRPLNFINSYQTKPTKSNLNQPNKESLFSSLSQNQKSQISIKYDTLKLSEYNTEEIKKQEQLYQKNVRDFKERFNTTKPISTKFQSKKNIIIQQEQSNDAYMDSLEAMNNSNLNRNHFSRKKIKNQSSTPSSRIKFLQQSKEQLNSQSLNLSEVQKIKQQLKRSKDVIKTLGLKNTDLQKTLEMRNTKLQQLESEASSRLDLGSNRRDQLQIERQVYTTINLYMKETVKDFMNQIDNIKMSPLLEQNIESFLAEILQLNQITVHKKLGIPINQPLINQINQYETRGNQKSNSIGLSKSILNLRSPLKVREDNAQVDQSISKIQRNQFQTAHVQSHITVVNDRQNAFMSSKIQHVNRKGNTVRMDLSSNKENMTPNKRPNADEEFKLLQKSLHKLKEMQKSLQTTPIQKALQTTLIQKSLLTPVPKRQNNLVQNKSQINYKDQDQYRNEYSIINKSYLSGMGRDENSGLNISVSNLDRSKSRRKRIFAETNHKE